jgi:ATP-dependent DNA helicase Rep
VLVDEYQDTNAVQYELLKALVAAAGRFTAVGDDDQSIYGWRGATIDNLQAPAAGLPAAEGHPLEQNYRSTGHILRAANAVIAHNPKLFEKKLWSDLGDGEPVRVLECDGEEHEAERAVARIQACARGQGGAAKFSDFAVLYRANHQAACSSRSCARRRSRTRCRAGRASSTAPRSRTCAPGCACWSTRTTTRPSCAP